VTPPLENHPPQGRPGLRHALAEFQRALIALGKWLTPGMGLKRWLSLGLAGMLTVNLGVFVLTYAALREVRGSGFHMAWWGFGLVACILGTYMAYVGARKVIRQVVRVLTPVDPPRLLDAFYRYRTRRGPKLVAIGGGTGLSTLLRGMKRYSDNITAIVAMADNGGSSGKLREELGALPPGDIRNCLTALAGEEELMTALFNHRFNHGTSLLGHSFGNLFLTAMAEVTGDFEQAVQASSRVLAVRGQVLPATLTPIELVATLEDGTEILGESQISKSKRAISEIRVVPEAPQATPDAVKAIRDADVIIIGPGSLYTSLAPNLLIPELREALHASNAPKIYICNVMTQPGETDGFTASDHAKALRKVAGERAFDWILVNQDPPERLRDRYEAQGQYPVLVDREVCERMGVQVLEASLLDEGTFARHDSQALALAIVQWLLTLRRSNGGKILSFSGEADPVPQKGKHR
jgi:uncharacterized cofD-like protein